MIPGELRVDFLMPDGRTAVGFYFFPPTVGDLLTVESVGDYVVHEVHFSGAMGPDVVKVFSCTVTLKDDPEGRQFNEWA